MLPYDPAKDFAPISLLTTAPLVLVAPASLPGEPEVLHGSASWQPVETTGPVGNGSVGHLGVELVKQRSWLDAVHIPYSGNPQVVTAMLGGRIRWR
jgi:tripartite-type tricarboxylate transporter receptor subunit TctC